VIVIPFTSKSYCSAPVRCRSLQGRAAGRGYPVAPRYLDEVYHRPISYDHDMSIVIGLVELLSSFFSLVIIVFASSDNLLVVCNSLMC
jgi:hypothetical protein